MRKSRSNVCACLSCTEQGLACTHADAARLVVSEAAADEADGGEADNEEEQPDKMKPLERIILDIRRSHRPRSSVPSVAALKHDIELRQHASRREHMTYKPVLACLSCEAVLIRGGHRGQIAARVEF